GTVREHPVGDHFVERTVEDLCRHDRLYVASKVPALLSVLDRLANDVGILGETGCREFAHVLDGSRELDLEHHGGIAVRSIVLEMQLGDLSQSINGRVKIRKLSSSFGDEPLHRAVKDRVKDLVLTFEIEIDRPVGDPSLGGDVRYFR